MYTCFITWILLELFVAVQLYCLNRFNEVVNHIVKVQTITGIDCIRKSKEMQVDKNISMIQRFDKINSILIGVQLKNNLYLFMAERHNNVR